MCEPASWIKIGPHGTFARSGSLSTTPADIDALLGEGLRNARHLLIHVHGGLVNESEGLRIAQAMAQHYSGAVRPLTVIWETGLLETFRDNLTRVTATTVFKKALSWVLAKAIAEWSDAAGARGEPAVDQKEIERHLQTAEGVEILDARLASQADRLDAQARGRGGAVGEKSEDALADELQWDINDLAVLIDNGEPGSEPIRRSAQRDSGARSGTAKIALFLARVIIAVVKRYRAGTHHDPVPTSVEELLRAAYLADVGRLAWDGMKTKAEEMWVEDGPAAADGAHVGTYLLDRLAALQRQRPGLTIDLVGHSAGSIVICAMLAAIKSRQLQVRLRRVCFLAPAVRLDTFKTAIASPTAFNSFRLFTMTDHAEKADKLVAIYPRSLLFLVSGLFEDRPGTALAGLARHITSRTAAADASYDDLRSWLATGDRLVFAPSPDAAPEGLRTRAARHGDFDDDPMTLASLRYLASEAP